MIRGEIIEWVRTDKTAYYRLWRPRAEGPEEAGEPRVSQNRPDLPGNIRALLRLGPVETESGDIDIHIGNQREPIFLLNSPGSQAAGFFAASSEAEYLLGMRQALKTRVDYAKTTRKVLASDCQNLEKALDRYQPLDGLEPELKQVEQTYAVISANQQSLPELSEFIGKLTEKKQTLGKQQQGAEIFSVARAPAATSGK